jgi:hypothetical protein
VIHYHGGPITPESAAVRVWTARHAFVSFAAPQQIECAAGISQSFALDNGAWSAFVAKQPTNWPGFYQWCEKWLSHPACDWAVIPDVIDGDEASNDALIAEWPFGHRGVPVWHLHETISRLIRLCNEWPRVALGSSGDYKDIGTGKWWARMNKAMNALCGEGGRPPAKLYGLRMLDPNVFKWLPFASADSTNVALNIGFDSAWRGTYTPASKETRGQVIAERVEQVNAAPCWRNQPEQEFLFNTEQAA